MILLVDDHIDTCIALRRLLLRSGFVAECVHGGADALAFVQSTRPGLIVLDEMMPDLTGTETLRRLRQLPGMADVPVLMYSAVADDSRFAEAMRLVAAGWIVRQLGGVSCQGRRILSPARMRRLAHA